VGETARDVRVYRVDGVHQTDLCLPHHDTGIVFPHAAEVQRPHAGEFGYGCWFGFRGCGTPSLVLCLEFLANVPGSASKTDMSPGE